MTALFLIATLLGGQETPPEAPIVPPTLISPTPDIEGVGRRGIPISIRVELTVLEDGFPADIVILKGAGEPWDSAVAAP